MDTNSYYWVPHPTEGFLPATLHPEDDENFRAVTKEGLEFDIARSSLTSELAPVHESSLQPTENLISLQELSEAALLHSLRLRFSQDQIYTWISTILISVNPFKHLPLYTKKIMHDNYEVAKRFELSAPHVYATAAQAYVKLCQAKNVQGGKPKKVSILIGGESGSGKSLSTLLCMHFFSEMSNFQQKNATTTTETSAPVALASPRAGGSITNDIINDEVQDMSASKVITQKILALTPILEAFANATTVRNNNSSRFGKYIHLFFTSTSFVLCGAAIESYLLEKSRIVWQSDKERNYHVFYQLFAGLSDAQRETYHLGEPSAYSIIKGSPRIRDASSDSEGDISKEITGLDDGYDFHRTIDALKHIGLTDVEIDGIWRVLAACLHLGNVQFQPAINTMNDSAMICDESIPSLQIVCELLGLDLTLLQSALLHQKSKMGKEWVTKNKNSAAAQSALFAVIKSIYGAQFEWLISTMNTALKPDGKGLPPAAKTNPTQYYHSIGLLDIFGFEVFDFNTFEQLCINYTNEKMHHHFTQHVFEIELEEYRREELNLDLDQIQYTDNQRCLDMIETGPACLLSLMDDELRIPRSSDQTLLEKFDAKYNGFPYYFKSKQREPKFTIQHYAGPVAYTVQDWLIKTKDDIQSDLVNVFALTNIPHLRSIMNQLLETTNQPQKTLGFKFKTQLASLMTMLNQSEPYFIRCIKSNDLLQPLMFDGVLIQKQISFLGLKEVVNIRQKGFPIRLAFQDFLLRYKLLLQPAVLHSAAGDETALLQNEQSNPQAIIAAILEWIDPSQKHWKIGKTKIFYRLHIQTALEQQREQAIFEQTVHLQAYVATALIRKRFVRRLQCINEMAGYVEHPTAQWSTSDLPAIENVIAIAQGLGVTTNNLEKRECVILQHTIYLQKRLIQQRDAYSALKQAIVSNNRQDILIALSQCRYAFSTPYMDQETDPRSLEVTFDNVLSLKTDELSNTMCKKEYPVAIALLQQLRRFDDLVDRTERERTLELALQCIQTAKSLGDSKLVHRSETLYNTIAEEVAERERRERLRRDAEIQQRREAEQQQRREAAEQAKAAAAEQAKAAAAAQIETDAELLQELDLVPVASATEGGLDDDLIASTENANSPLRTPQKATRSLDPLASARKATQPEMQPLDYNRLAHLIETGNHDGLVRYLRVYKAASRAAAAALADLDPHELDPTPRYDEDGVYHSLNPADPDARTEVPHRGPAILQLNTPHSNGPYSILLPLTQAAERGDIEAIQILLSFGADINGVCGDGFTALGHAIMKQKYTIARILLEKYDLALSQFDCDLMTGDCIGHLLAQSFQQNVASFRTGRAQQFLSLLRLVCETNDTVIFNVANDHDVIAKQLFLDAFTAYKTGINESVDAFVEQVRGIILNRVY